MDTGFSLKEAINFINEQAPTMPYFPENIDLKSLETAVKIIHDTFTDTEVSKDDINQLITDLKILKIHAKNPSIQGIITDCLNLTKSIVPEEIANHSGYFGPTINKGKELIEKGIAKGEIKGVANQAHARLYTKFCFEKAFQRKTNKRRVVDIRGQHHEITQRLFLFRDSSTVKNTEDIKFFVLSYPDGTMSFQDVEHRLCGYNSKTKKWSAYENVAGETNPFRTKSNWIDLVKDVIRSRGNLQHIKPDDYKVEDFLSRYSMYL